MLLVFISWIWIGISSFLVGYSALNILNRCVEGKNNSGSIDLSVVFGLCLLTVYAQFFSLFHSVGMVANVIVLLIDILIIYVYRKQLRDLVKTVIKTEFVPQNIFLYILAILLVGIVLALTSSPINLYDTYLYHAQSIRWIEEYGIVPGLGNLHNRFAYNSSIFSLQALFSMKWLLGRSMHSVNGFIMCFFIIHAILSMRVFKEQKLFISDFFRIGMLIFCNLSNTYESISSPGSDLFAIGLFFYVVEKVVTLIEDDCREIAPYAHLCILSVFAVTVKLSVAMLVLFTIIPICFIIREKKWKDLCIYLVSGMIVVLPFLIRNVIISGYLIYPYPAIDLFDVDWKMPRYTLLFDSNEIKSWGWGLKDVKLFDTPIQKWFPVWFGGLSYVERTLFVVNVLLILMSLVWVVRQVRNRKYKETCILLVIVANLILWFIGAPLPRYGMPFMLLLPLGTFAIFGEKFIKKQVRYISKITVIICLAICLPIIGYALRMVAQDEVTEMVQIDYAEYACEENSWEGQIVYTPVEGDKTGYHYFPATPYGKRLGIIELRGDSFEDGFCIKEEYRKAYISTHGNISEENMFEVN